MLLAFLVTRFAAQSANVLTRFPVGMRGNSSSADVPVQHGALLWLLRSASVAARSAGAVTSKRPTKKDRCCARGVPLNSTTDSVRWTGPSSGMSTPSSSRSSRRAASSSDSPPYCPARCRPEGERLSGALDGESNQKDGTRGVEQNDPGGAALGQMAGVSHRTWLS